jgi:Putative prokaryotic signal transducing protein
VQLAVLSVIHEETEVEAIRELLRAHGIESRCRRTDIAAGAWTGWCCTGGPVELLVSEADLEAARELVPEVSSELPLSRS